MRSRNVDMSNGYDFEIVTYPNEILIPRHLYEQVDIAYGLTRADVTGCNRRSWSKLQMLKTRPTATRATIAQNVSCNPAT